MLRLYDARRGSTVDVTPARPGELRLYACGRTGNGSAHLGDLRTAVLADLIRRNAERHGLSVVACELVPDAGHRDAGDDDFLTAAGAGEQEYRADFAALNILPPDFAPRASESIDAVIDMIATLIRAGHAYVAPSGSVYFDSRSVPDDGALSGDRLDALKPVHGSRPEANQEKRFPGDWVLWKNAREDRDMARAAPWGTGLPSWTAECSAVSLKLLGDVIDIHTGASGLCVPHHEAERAEANALAGHEVVRHWAFGAQVLFDGRAMARSTGNVVLLSDLAGRGLDPLAARLECLEHHYRQPMDLTWATLATADGTVRRWRDLVADWADEPSKPMCAEYSSRFSDALDDDLDTPAALRILRELAEDPEIPAGSKFETFASADRVLGLDLVSLVGRPRTPAGSTPP